jgi:hypothetical protein
MPKLHLKIFINQHNVAKLTLIQLQEQKQKAKLSDILKNANEEQCFGNFMKISETAGVDNGSQTTSITKFYTQSMC